MRFAGVGIPDGGRGNRSPRQDPSGKTASPEVRASPRGRSGLRCTPRTVRFRSMEDASWKPVPASQITRFSSHLSAQKAHQFFGGLSRIRMRASDRRNFGLFCAALVSYTFFPNSFCTRLFLSALQQVDIQKKYRIFARIQLFSIMGFLVPAMPG